MSVRPVAFACVAALLAGCAATPPASSPANDIAPAVVEAKAEPANAPAPVEAPAQPALVGKHYHRNSIMPAAVDTDWFPLLHFSAGKKVEYDVTLVQHQQQYDAILAKRGERMGSGNDYLVIDQQAVTLASSGDFATCCKLPGKKAYSVLALLSSKAPRHALWAADFDGSDKLQALDDVTLAKLHCSSRNRRLP